jgi:surfeit locus 1 family protein
MATACLAKDYSRPMGNGERIFRPRIGPFLLLFVPACICVGLGLWQCERAEQKRELARELSERAAAAPLEVGDAILEPDAVRYRRVVVRGQLERDGQIFIENRHHAGQIGFHVVTPLKIAGSDRRVLVNRGWVPTMNAEVPDGLVTVHGVADVPSAPALVLHGNDEAARQWGQRWPYLTLPLYTAIASYPLQPIVVLLDPEDANGFARYWPRELPKERMHIGYAVQWVAFALIGFVLFVRLSWVRAEVPPEKRA